MQHHENAVTTNIRRRRVRTTQAPVNSHYVCDACGFPCKNKSGFSQHRQRCPERMRRRLEIPVPLLEARVDVEADAREPGDSIVYGSESSNEIEPEPEPEANDWFEEPYEDCGLGLHPDLRSEGAAHLFIIINSSAEEFEHCCSFWR